MIDRRIYYVAFLVAAALLVPSAIGKFLAFVGIVLCLFI